jgi:hypothetical protein
LNVLCLSPQWGGECEDSNKAQAGLAGSIPLFALTTVVVPALYAIFYPARAPE